MATKKTNIEELKAMCLEAEQNFKDLQNQLAKAEKEEKEQRAAKLAQERDARKKEVDESLAACKKLLRAYMRDYGTYFCASDDDIFDMFNSKFWNAIF